jgi:hypothetical protein
MQFCDITICHIRFLLILFTFHYDLIISLLFPIIKYSISMLSYAIIE